ncbi:type II secretion system protein GspK [Colwellia sp. E2M01]|uniref:type II secretion system protein GspK n=1 Tax=Colwellia sp. E2M01 TaxID=2841561 RepID=UPI001C0A5BFB|nr:type II secretion system protein GspK [Colwellia sp. E2M01]MBU2869358.1 general secretion pathway protein GspK [Colwellia sp. E2M01]
MGNRTRGAALIIVLFIAAILGSMATLMIVKTKQHIERITIAKDFMQAERLLISDMSELIFVTQTTPYAIFGDNTDFTVFNTLPKNINLQGVPFVFQNSEFRLQDMGGLIPLLPFDKTLFIRYLEHLAWPDSQIHQFIDVMQDWQDNDGFTRINGAESFSYNVFGYPLNQPLQSVNEIALFANIESKYINRLINDNNVTLFGAGATTLGYAPDDLLPVFNTEFDAKLIQKTRDESRKSDDALLPNQYPTGNWVIKISTSYGQAKSSKMLHLVRRFGELRPFVISR